MEWITEYLIGECYVVIPALYIIGAALKRIPKVPDWVIPFALGALSIAACLCLIGPGIDAVLQGVLCAGASVYANQLVKQGKERR